MVKKEIKVRRNVPTKSGPEFWMSEALKTFEGLGAKGIQIGSKTFSLKGKKRSK